MTTLNRYEEFLHEEADLWTAHFDLRAIQALAYSSSMSPKPTMRVVGRKSANHHYQPGGLKGADHLLQMLRRMPGGQSIAPHGVYRFRSHEEADEWLMKMLTRPGRGRRR